jgi:hypothetical protein
MFDVTKPLPLLGQVRLGQFFYAGTPMQSYGSFVSPGWNAYEVPAAPPPVEAAEGGDEMKCYHCNKPSEFKRLTPGQAKAWSDPTGLDRGCEEVSNRECNQYSAPAISRLSPYGSFINFGAAPSVSFGMMGAIPLAPGMGRSALG